MIRRFASVFVFAAILLFSPGAFAGGAAAEDSDAPRAACADASDTGCDSALPGWLASIVGLPAQLAANAEANERPAVEPRVVSVLPGLTMCFGDTFARMPAWLSGAICDVTVPLPRDRDGSDRTVRAASPPGPERG